MHHAKNTVTIYRKAWDSKKGIDVYLGTVITGVSFFAKIDTAVSTDGLTAANHAICRIPGNIYPKTVEPKNGDLICIGAQTEVPENVNEIPEPYFTIVGITDNRSGKCPHIKVVCK